MRLRFGDCILDTERHELTRGRRLVPLSPKAFRLLEVLVESRPRVVPRTELRRLVWPDTTAGGTTVARLVNQIRSALGDRALAGGFIRTVPRVGYAFAGAADEEPRPAPRSLSDRAKGGTPEFTSGVPEGAEAAGCALQWGVRQVPLRPGENVIGRTAGAVISVASPKVSRRHARILIADGRATLEDLGSKNGTYLGERKIDGPAELQHGDRIGIGPVLLIFRVSRAEEATPTDRSR